MATENKESQELKKQIKALKKADLVKAVISLPNPQQRCIAQHAGQCGTCSETGVFTPCG